MKPSSLIKGNRRMRIETMLHDFDVEFLLILGSVRVFFNEDSNTRMWRRVLFYEMQLKPRIFLVCYSF